jgi:hypothetical protein
MAQVTMLKSAENSGPLAGQPGLIIIAENGDRADPSPLSIVYAHQVMGR